MDKKSVEIPIKIIQEEKKKDVDEKLKKTKMANSKPESRQQSDDEEWTVVEDKSMDKKICRNSDQDYSRGKDEGKESGKERRKERTNLSLTFRRYQCNCPYPFYQVS